MPNKKHWILVLSLCIYVNSSEKEVNDGLKKVNDWDFQWKISFDADSCKQAQEVIFTRKSKKLTYMVLFFKKKMSLKPFLTNT